MGSKGMGWPFPIRRLCYWKAHDASIVRVPLAVHLPVFCHHLLVSHCRCCCFCWFDSDLVLLQDKKFMKWVKYYAKDGAKFSSDFSSAFQKLLELGTSGLTPTEWA